MILIIDDDSAVRSSLSFMLKRAGYSALAVPGPREAMDVVRSETPDLILMDMNFTLSTTGEEGLTLLKQVKIFRPDVPVILMTAWGSIQLAVQGMQAGAFDFITKPFTDYEIYSVMDDYLAVVHADEERKLMFPTDDGTICLSINDIYYFMYESKKKVYVHTFNERILVKQHLMEIYSNLDKSRFYRSRRDCILNLKYVKKIKNNFVIVMRNGDLLPLAQRKKDEFVAMLTKEYVNSMKGGYKSLSD